MYDDFVFFSYSHKDKDFVNKLKSDLNNKGVKTWIDVDQIKPGSKWMDEIVKNIEKSRLIILVLSANYLISNWVQLELNYIKGKKIIPINIDNEIKVGLPENLLNIQWIDFHNYNTGFSILLDEIPKDLLSNSPVQTTTQISEGYVFISFCEDDSDFVIKLREILKKQNFAYWDFEEGTRNYHIQFFLELESAIEGAVAVLSIISPNWKSSKWSIREYIYAEEIGKPVFLLKVKKTEPILAISGQPYIEFVINEKSGFKKLEKELSKILRKIPNINM